MHRAPSIRVRCEWVGILNPHAAQARVPYPRRCHPERGGVEGPASYNFAARVGCTLCIRARLRRGPHRQVFVDGVASVVPKRTVKIWDGLQPLRNLRAWTQCGGSRSLRVSRTLFARSARPSRFLRPRNQYSPFSANFAYSVNNPFTRRQATGNLMNPVALAVDDLRAE